MPRTYYDSRNFFPSKDQVTYNLPLLKLLQNQFVHKTTVEMTTRRPNLSPSYIDKPEKLQSLPSEFKSNIKFLHAIQVSKDKFVIKQIYPIETNQRLSPNVSNGDGFATATSVTSADNPVSIPALQQSEWSLGGATLILEPSSKAVSGNGGTAISSPVSRAILRKNMGTRVLYRPESVAVAGVGGTAHAQSELILDYVE